MAVNTKTEYALRALIEIATQGQVSAQKICEAQNLPKKYIEHLLSLMKSAKIINSSAGILGGYSLAKEADEISFQSLLEAVGDESFATACKKRSGTFCLGQGCTLAPFFTKLEDQLSEIFEAYTLQDIINIWERKV
ncbi:MAG: Rrf2 family transcriptional regulator [Candidatus Cloacimonetes bacterium]|jgi:Rrf2 family protein|nr:Rrf2 family transcriptional regulator [Candidatus Cloacimonadota bacterium]MDD2423689.1 Rrf2 family transcriptional regulator [Candidatus Cloacimonadota bacterium]MDD3562532.1 Rrf2 family transcriptional regulator [Candidatus Cloacimonadota bacterium]MDD4277820.1 Rrf2 family transcriptional regulator [Candidatus Cloacimonadota bacterium]MDY0325925.1 Rrf2 family transcriptional regulator [Candidatus Cloacimonadaceae bacterium]